MELSQITQQMLEANCPDAAQKLCAPTALYIASLKAGYELPDAATFTSELDWANGWDVDLNGWRRNELSDWLRTQFKIPIVSWRIDRTGASQDEPSIRKMKQLGYIQSAHEEAFLRDVVFQSSRDELLGSQALVATMLPGFGENTSMHAVVLDSHNIDRDEYKVVDPDERNTKTVYSRRCLEASLNGDGLYSAVL